MKDFTIVVKPPEVGVFHPESPIGRFADALLAALKDSTDYGSDIAVQALPEPFQLLRAEVRFEHAFSADHPDEARVQIELVGLWDYEEARTKREPTRPRQHAATRAEVRKGRRK